MPEVGFIAETVLVPPDQYVRAIVDRAVNAYATRNFDGLSKPAVLKHVESMKAEATKPFEVEIYRGSMDISDIPTRSVPSIYEETYETLTVCWVSLDTARTLLEVASNGMLSLEERSRGSDQYLVAPVHPVDRRVYLDIYNGILEVDNYGGSGGQPYFTHRRLVQMVERYRTWRLHNRRQSIRDFFRKQMSGDLGHENVVKDIETDAFTSFVNKVQRATKHESQPLDDAPMLDRGTVSSRKWGIEVEMASAAGIDIPAFWESKEDSSLESVGGGYRHYEHESDCAYLSDDEDYCDCAYNGGDQQEGYSEPAEFVSPPLHSFHSRGLEYICDQQVDRQKNSSAGIHVHVEAIDLTPNQAVKVALFYTLFERLFEDVYERDTRYYCQSLTPSQLIERMNKARRYKKEGRGVQDYDWSSRYHTVNLAALEAHGTIEFRAMGPVYEYETLLKWAWLCREFVNLAKSNVSQHELGKVHTFRDLVTLFAKYGKETPTPEWAPDVPVKDLSSLKVNNYEDATGPMVFEPDNQTGTSYFEDYSREYATVFGGYNNW